MTKVVILISGRGSNMLALLRQQEKFQVAAVFSDQPQAAGLLKAQEFKVPLIGAFPRSDYATKLEQKQAIYRAIKDVQPDFIALAGFMQIIEAGFAQDNLGRLINIHPAFLRNRQEQLSIT